MLLSEVGYARPASVDEAVRLLAENEGARPLAGGQTIVNVMKARAAAPDVLVDLADLSDLRRIAATADGGVELGALVTYTQILTSAEVKAARPVLVDVSGQIADVQVRNRGTVGGNVCSNDPTNHLPPVLVAAGATLTIVGRDGDRTVPAEDFFLGVYMTAVGPGELLTKITLPPLPGGGDGFSAITIGADGTCIVSAAATVDGERARVALGCVAATPVLLETGCDEASVREAVRGAGLDPPSDVHGSAEYRRHLAGIVAARAVASAGEDG
ncbi:MAG TPA: xanthine dehydrogenase family protein subunit M [Gaiellaceae bacterium]|nr:xanthine dehydrogenase family protein subunit M [Gaiellaceae bacterium]